MIDRQRVFEALRARLGRLTQDQVRAGDLLLDAIDQIAPDATDHIVSVIADTQARALDLACDLVARWEGFIPRPYRDVAGVLTIGYGFTDPNLVSRNYLDRDEADQILRARLSSIINNISSMVRVELNPYQLAALASFAYNVGLDALRRSTLLRRLNAGDVAGAADELRRWIYAAGRPIEGLRRRREAERALFLRTN